jgi:hypothetical protein
MSNKESIYTEVRSLVEDRLAAGAIIHANWITSEIFQKHSNIEGEDVWFYQLCARSHVQDIVKRVVAKYGDKDEESIAETDSQLVFPGFEHLRKGYFVERNNQRVLVPVNMLTDSELQARAAEYDQMSAGCKKHAQEIRKFLSKRAEAA